MDILPFADWKPDLAPYKAASSQLIENVFPRADGYGPVAANTVTDWSALRA